jgi:SNF2 family DNA or RNA helicase
VTFKEYPFQRETINFGIKNPYSIYALGMGLGKTYCSIATAVETNSKALVICPAYLRLKWKAEIKKFYPDKTVSMFKNDKEFYPLFDTDFAIISYHFIPKAESLFEWADMVIIDEAHSLKSMKAKRTEESHRLIYENSIKRLLLLTGTPILNRVYEFYSLLALCNYNPKLKNSKFLEEFESYVDFANHFSHLTEFDIYRGNKRVKVQQWEGHRNIDELKTYLTDCYIRFTTDEVLDLPPYQEIDVPISYEDNVELEEAFLAYTSRGEETSVASDVKAKAALAKVPFTVDYVKNLLDQCEQVVVYTDHVDSCIALAKGLGATAITGQTSMKLRQELADRFSRGEDRVIVATIGSFSTGIDLISASNMVYNDFNWVPGQMYQSMYRIRRIGQKNRCIFHRIIGSFQDHAIIKKLTEKIETIEAVI